VVIDIGTGDGRAVVRRARSEREALVIGIDSDASRLRETSGRAARAERKVGLTNTMFLVATAETLPGPLAGVADVVTVTLPWGSLLRGLATADPRITAPVVSVLRPEGELELMLSVGPRDVASGAPPLDAFGVERLVEAYADTGLRAFEARPVTAADVDAAGSTWARRLGIPDHRGAWRLRFRKVAATPAEPMSGSATSDAHTAATTPHS
jgi:hypothetical protein